MRQFCAKTFFSIPLLLLCYPGFSRCSLAFTTITPTPCTWKTSCRALSPRDSWFRRRTTRPINDNALELRESFNDEIHPVSEHNIHRRARWLINSALSLNEGHLQQSVGRIREYLLPPIPRREVSAQRWQDQFRPKLALREFLIGTRMTMRLYIPLFLIGWIVERASVHFPPFPSASIQSFSAPSYLHIWDHGCKSMVLEEFPFLRSLFVRNIVTGPIIEEIAYRGLGFFTTYYGLWVALLMWSYTAAFLPPLALAWSMQVGWKRFTKMASLVIQRAPLFEIVRFGWDNVMTYVFWIALGYRLLKSTRGADDALSPRQKRSSLPSNIMNRQTRQSQAIVDGAIRKNGSITEQEKSSLRSYVHSMLTLITRWRTSATFASAHLPSGTPDIMSQATNVSTLDSVAQYRCLQKYFGVFSSSFLIESRLASSRGTLWGAMGAHMCFNLLAFARVYLGFFIEEIGLLCSVPLIGFVLIVFQHYLDDFASRAKHLEDSLCEC